MARCRVDPSIERVVRDGFAFPLGIYPVEELTPKAGFTTAFESADGDEAPGLGLGGGGMGGGGKGEGGGGKGEGRLGKSGGMAGGGGGVGGGGDEDDDEGVLPGGMVGGGGAGGAEWEEWPDRYVFDILVPATRIESLCRALFALLPGRVYPILDFLGQDEWREVDPYVSYDLIGLDRFLEALRRFRGFFFEDGLVGFGAMSEEPFIYVFVDEHKVVTVRVQSDMKERLETVLAAFDLPEVDELLSADSVTHEHRAVLDAPDDRRDLLNAEEIVEVLRDDWHMVLNIDPESNVDEEGNDLGITGWRCILRYDPPPPAPPAPPPAPTPPTPTPGAERKKKNGKAAPTPPPEAPEESADEPALRPPPVELPEPRYAHIFLTADSLNRATELAVEGLEGLLEKEEQEQRKGKDKKGGKNPATPPSIPSTSQAPPNVGDADADEGGDDLDLGDLDADFAVSDPFLVQADRWGEADFVREVETVTGKKPDMRTESVRFAEWLQ